MFLLPKNYVSSISNCQKIFFNKITFNLITLFVSLRCLAISSKTPIITLILFLLNTKVRKERLSAILLLHRMSNNSKGHFLYIKFA